MLYLNALIGTFFDDNKANLRILKIVILVLTMTNRNKIVGFKKRPQIGV